MSTGKLVGLFNVISCSVDIKLEEPKYKKVIKINSQDPEGYFGLAKTYLYRTSEIDLALKNALKALELYKKNPPNYIGDVYNLWV